MDIDFSSFLPPGWSEVDMDCSLGCTPLSIDDWESFKEARKEERKAPYEDIFVDLENCESFRSDFEKEENIWQ